MISDPWISRVFERKPRTRKYCKTPLELRQRTANRRALLESLGKCINGPLVGNVGKRGTEHGEPVKYGKCRRCLDAHELSR